MEAPNIVAIPNGDKPRMIAHQWITRLIASAEPTRLSAAEKNRERGRAHRQKYPERVLARRLFKAAVRRGKIQKQPCQDCGATQKLQGHHQDYSNPLDIVWLCHRCHCNRHRKRPAKTD